MLDRMFLTGGGIDSAWDVGTASYVKNFSIAAQEANPTGVFFKPDGTAMYVIGVSGAAVYQYFLSTAWDVGTTSYVKNFSITAQENNPSGLFFKPDGTVMYVIGVTGDDVNQYSLSTAWDVGTATYVKVFSVVAQDTAPTGLFFKPDGTAMYVIGTTGDAVYQYSLSTAWDVGTASYVKNFSITAQETAPSGLFFKSDGTAMYVIGSTGDDINQYSLSTAWDIATASYVKNFSVAAQETIPQDVFFKPDGTAMYVIGVSADTVYQYAIGT